MSGVGWGWGLGRARGTSLRIHLENRESIRCSHARSMDADRLRRKHRHKGPPLDTSVWVFNEDFANTYMCGSRGGGGQGVRPPPPTGKLQKYRVPLQYWSRFPEKSQSYQASIPCCYHRPASETPFKWRFAGGPLMTR